MNEFPTLSLHSGAHMPVMGLGTWQLIDDTAGTVAYALENGYRLIDTSSDYGTQPGIGEAIKRTGIDREKIYITTKVEETDDAYERVQSNLAELDLEYVDLLLIHRPPETGAGEELWEGLRRAQKEGLARDIGVSNYSVDLMNRFIEATGDIPAVNQIEWSPFGHSEAMKQYCDEKNIVIQAYSPLTRAKRLDDERLSEVAARYGKSPAQLLIRWNIQLETVPIPKANLKTHLDKNLAVFDFDISKGDMKQLESLNEAYSSLGKLPYV